MMVRMLSISGLALAALAPASNAQATTVATETRVNLRRDASTVRSPIRVLKALEQLEVTGAGQNGFLPVRTTRGEVGWVSSDYVFVEGADSAAALASTELRVIGLDAPAADISTDWERPPVGMSTLQHLPGDGTRCGPRGAEGGDWETFILKNRTDVPTVSHAVSFTSLDVLPYRKGGLKKDRTGSQWTAEQKQTVGRYEGIPLTITGFLAAVRPQGSSSTGEGTNCKWKGESNTDWHMALVPNHRDGEEKSLVVEPTPRFKRRHPKWRKELLADRVGDQRSSTDSVRISGFLFYDPDHKAHITQGYRSTMWELHPVTRIEIFVGGAWVDLDDR
jgi:uncharacterized protein YraI